MKSTKKIKMYALKAAKIGRKDKKVKGFTLVELIIVIAIIGVLAAVLIPTMSGKVRDSKIATAQDQVAKVVEQAGIVSTELETSGDTCYVGKTYACTVNPLSSTGDNFAKAMIAALPDIAGKKVFIRFNADGAVVAASYADNDATNYVGVYSTDSSIKQTDKNNYKQRVFDGTEAGNGFKAPED